jgi:hypothetical protein
MSIFLLLMEKILMTSHNNIETPFTFLFSDMLSCISLFFLSKIDCLAYSVSILKMVIKGSIGEIYK